MADLDPNPARASDAASPSAGTATLSPGRGTDADPLASLKKMSTTAGLGSGDYVAINAAAVAATMLGLLTVFVPIFSSNILLVIPLAAVICAIVAWWQIADSNGTQSGKILVAAGLLLALLIGGGYLGVQAVAGAKSRGDEQKMMEMMSSLGRDIGAHDFRSAYAMFGERFKVRIKEDRFNETLDSLNRSREAGAVKSIESNGRIEFVTETGTGDPEAAAMAFVRFEKTTEPYRLAMRFKKVDDRWIIDDIPTLFPPEVPKSGQRPGGPRM